MKRQALLLSNFSFICFIAVFVFGLAFGPLQKAYGDHAAVMRNLSLFHNHFDQLCWLGAAALGATLYVARDRFAGSERVLRVFGASYMLGTSLFSMAFLARALGLILASPAVERHVFLGLVSVGGLFEIVALSCGCYVASHILSARPRIPNEVKPQP